MVRLRSKLSVDQGGRSPSQTSLTISSFFPVRKRSPPEGLKSMMTSTSVKRARLCVEHIDESDTELTCIDADEYPPEPSFSNKRPVLSSCSYDSFFTLCENLPVETLTQYALSCPVTSERILQYCRSGSFRSRFIRDALQFLQVPFWMASDVSDPFKLYGYLLKSVTFSSSTKTRIQLAIEDFMCKARTSIKTPSGWGNFLVALTSRWHFKECERIIEALMNLDNRALSTTVDKLLNAPVGTYPQLEMKVRICLRGLFLDAVYEDKTERAFWLSALLKSRSQKNIEHRSRLLSLMYCPLKVGDDGAEVIDWDGLCQAGVQSLAESIEKIKPMADALARLADSQTIDCDEYKMANSDVFNIMEEVTTSPEPWCLDNFTALMLHQNGLLSIAVLARMSHGFEEEAGTISANLKSLAHRWSLNATELLERPLMEVVRVLSVTKRREFLRTFFRANSQLLEELALGAAPEQAIDEMRAQSRIAYLLKRLVRMI